MMLDCYGAVFQDYLISFKFFFFDRFMNLNSDCRLFYLFFMFIFIYFEKNVINKFKPQNTHLLNQNQTHADSDYEPPIYYFGDKNVTLGEPFSITCFINIKEPIRWLKDGESITRHNLRHGRDEHSYRVSEFPIEGKFFIIRLW